MRVAAVSPVHVPEAGDLAGPDRAQRYLVSAAPVAVVGSGRDPETTLVVASRVLHETVQLAEILWQIPWPVGARVVDGGEQRSPAEVGAAGDEAAVIVVLTDCQAGHRLGQRSADRSARPTPRQRRCRVPRS